MVQIGAGDIYVEEPKREAEKEDAINYLIKTAKENPGGITIVAIGPLTNIAHCIMKDKEFAKNVKSLIIMGGSAEKGNITEFAEFNFYKDPEAAKIVFEAGFEEVIMVGWHVTIKLPFLDKFENMLNNMNNEIAKFLYDITRKGAAFDRNRGFEGSIMSDSLTIAYLIDNNVLKLKDEFVNIMTEGEKIGMSNVVGATNGRPRTCNARPYNVQL